jgi:CubicO group peptidase (beta-lactamase class C family)
MTSDELQARLDKLCQAHMVPGAAAAVLRDGKVLSAVSGVVNTTTQAPVRLDTLFAAGSVTKAFTAALVMTLVDDGLIDLDVTVQTYLPDLALADPEKAAKITLRMLLCHSAGLPGTYFPDTPDGPEVLAAYVAQLNDVPVVGTPGRLWSYSNPGMVILGRLVEVVTGQSYDQALASRVLEPLAANATTDLNELVLRSTAVGHFADLSSGTVERAPVLRAWPSNGPAGATLWCDISTFVSFARMHLDGGTGQDTRRVLSAQSTAAMQVPQYDEIWGVPGCDNWGLGWELRGAGTERVAMHTGANIGMHSLLALVPEQGGAVAILTNSSTGHQLNAELSSQLLDECFGVRAPAPFGPPEQAAGISDIDRFVGLYRSAAGTVTVESRDGALHLVNEPDASLAGAQAAMGIDGLNPQALPLTCVDAERARFLADAGPHSTGGAWMPVEFSEPDGDGRTQLVRVGMLYERV